MVPRSRSSVFIRRSVFLLVAITFCVFALRFYRSVTGGMALPPPQQLSPRSGSVFNVFPRVTTLDWSRMPGAVEYGVEVDFNYGGSWVSDHSEWRAKPATYRTAQTPFTFKFIGAQPGRWRVWAIDKNRHEGRKSPWWEFTYSR